ncbi:type II toxin-antitoxin system ribonuclease VapC1 [Humibacter antri]
MKRLVLDASAVVDAISGGAARVLPDHEVQYFEPAVMPYEVADVLRKLGVKRRTTLSDQDAEFELLMEFPATYSSWETVADRVWALRHNLTSTDASYVAVAELADAVLVTTDRRLADAPGIRCAVEVLP